MARSPAAPAAAPQTRGPDNSSFLAHRLGPVTRGIFLAGKDGHAPSETFPEAFNGTPLPPLHWLLPPPASLHLWAVS